MQSNSGVWSPPRLHEVCAIFGHPLRVEMFALLGTGPLAVGDLAVRMQLGLGDVSRHLRRAQPWGLVAWRRIRTRHMYTLGPAVLSTERSDGVLVLRIVTAGGGELVVKLPQAT